MQKIAEIENIPLFLPVVYNKQQIKTGILKQVIIWRRLTSLLPTDILWIRTECMA